MKNKRYNTVGKVPESNVKIVERGKIDNPNKQIHDVTHKYMTDHLPVLI